MAFRVVASFESPEHDRCVDIFVRDDGTFGYEVYRRDSEDLRGWFPLQRHSRQVFTAEGDALAHARANVPWLDDVDGASIVHR